MKNVGPADDLTIKILRALHDDSLVFLVLDQARTVQVQNVRRLDEQLFKELSVTCTDVEDDTEIILHLPYADNSVAWARINRPNTEGA